MTIDDQIKETLTWFRYSHLPKFLQDVSRPFWVLANDIESNSAEGCPEILQCLRKLLEAKDCAVRAALKD